MHEGFNHKDKHFDFIFNLIIWEREVTKGHYFLYFKLQPREINMWCGFIYPTL